MTILSSHNTNATFVQKKLEASMPWIGMYVALASIICSFAMIADVIHGFRSKKLWFPSKYFPLNATSLTLLAVAMKLPLDLTTFMWTTTDRLAKISSIAFLSTAMANFMPSLGSMGDKDMLINIAALVILVITVIVDVCIQIVETLCFLHQRVLFPEEILAMFLMLLLLLLLISSAIMILATKKFLEAKYQEMHNVALKQDVTDMDTITTSKLIDLVKKYWLMTETSCPQFVIARSATCSATGVVCVLNALVLAEAQIRMAVVHKRFNLAADSSYGFSTRWILLAQSIGVTAGTIAPASRWCTSLTLINRNSKDDHKVEAYWTQKLKDWKRCPLPSQIRHRTSRKCLHSAKQLTLNLLVRIQIFMVLFSKALHGISTYATNPFIMSFKFIKYLRNRQRVASVSRCLYRETESVLANPHSLRLEGEADLPGKTLKSIRKEVDKVIQRGNKLKLKSLLKLLEKSFCNFKGVIEFDSCQVESLHEYGEPPNCWSLPVITLASIAIALPNMAKDRVNNLVSSVSEGLYCVKIIEKCLYENRDLINITKAADIWERIELFRKWQEMDLCQISCRSRNATELLQELANEGKRIVSEFKKGAKTCLMKNPRCWKPNVIAANAMYRTCKTILLGMEGGLRPTEGELFDKLSVMIAAIMAACLTNLTRVITAKCHEKGIEEREQSVYEAALLLGQTEDILEFIRRIDTPELDQEQAADIDAWRILLQLEFNGSTTSSSSGSAMMESGEITSPSSRIDSPDCGGDHVAIMVVEPSQGSERNSPTIAAVIGMCSDFHREHTSKNTLAAAAPTRQMTEA